MRTTNSAMAMFLEAKGHHMTSIGYDSTEGKVELVFPDSEAINNLVQKYKFAQDEDEDLLVNVKELEIARLKVMDRVKGN